MGLKQLASTINAELSINNANAYYIRKRLQKIALLTFATLVVGGIWTSLTELTYACVHIFLLLPLVLLMFLPPSPLSQEDPTVRKIGCILPFVLSGVAFYFSSFWDNFIASKGVWTFDASKMLGTAGSIPFEEYFWFIDHTFITVFFVVSIWVSAPIPEQGNSRWLFRLVAVLFCGAVSYWGYTLLDNNNTLYLAIILTYMFPMIGIQIAAGGHLLLQQQRQWLLGILVPSVYLIGLDRWVIAQGVWAISDNYTTGINLLSIKLEQILIYSTTTALVAQTTGILLRLVEVYKARHLQEESVLWTLTKVIACA